MCFIVQVTVDFTSFPTPTPFLHNNFYPELLLLMLYLSKEKKNHTFILVPPAHPINVTSQVAFSSLCTMFYVSKQTTCNELPCSFSFQKVFMSHCNQS